MTVLAAGHSRRRGDLDNDNAVSSTRTVDDVTKLDAAFTKYVFDEQLSGAALGVLHKDRLVYGDGRGFVRGHDAEAGTLMPVLGLSKLLTAVTVLRLADHGKLRLGDKVCTVRLSLAVVKCTVPMIVLVTVPVIVPVIVLILSSWLYP